MVPEDASYLGLCRADAGQKFPDSTRGDAACRTDHLRQGLGGREDSQSAPNFPPTQHTLHTRHGKATAFSDKDGIPEPQEGQWQPEKP